MVDKNDKKVGCGPMREVDGFFATMTPRRRQSAGKLGLWAFPTNLHQVALFFSSYNSFNPHNPDTACLIAG